MPRYCINDINIVIFCCVVRKSYTKNHQRIMSMYDSIVEESDSLIDANPVRCDILIF